jgi:transcription termination factor Rho
MQVPTTLDLPQLESLSAVELHHAAQTVGLSISNHWKRQDLIFRLLQEQAERTGSATAQGVLEVGDDAHGFLRHSRLLPSPHDIYISMSQVRRFGLRNGDLVGGQVRPPKESERYFSMLRVETVNEGDPEEARSRVHFDDLTPIYPTDQLVLECSESGLEGRMIDLIAPIGRGQRGLISAPHRAGTTSLLRNIARGIAANYADVQLMFVLLAERPEELTEWQRTGVGEILGTYFDEPPEHHVRMADMAIDRARRLAELNCHVVVLLDSMTRLARACHLAVPPIGRSLPNGIDSSALVHVKRLFGAARNLESGGSLTILGTCLTETGNLMDETISDELSGTANMTVTLDRTLHQRGTFPAVDIRQSCTLRPDTFLDTRSQSQILALRRALGEMPANDATDFLVRRINSSANNRSFLESFSQDVA